MPYLVMQRHPSSSGYHSLLSNLISSSAQNVNVYEKLCQINKYAFEWMSM